MTEFQIKQENFEGPLELLLELIDKEKMDISKVSLAKVADEYLKHVKALDKVNAENLAEFLVVAAQLMLIKSRSLLPSLTLSEEDETSIEDLETRLAAYQRMRERARELKARENKTAIFTRESFFGIDPVFYPPPRLTLEALAVSFRNFLATIPKIEKLVEDKIKRIISLEDTITRIKSFLASTLEKAFSEVVRGSKEKVEIIVSFLAILELAKQKFVELDQDTRFGDIMIKKTESNDQ